MNTRSFTRIATLVAATQVGLACSRFVWHEDPFTPDPAPASETLISGRDTTYVLKGASYYLLASQRGALWNREVLDDVAWRYHALFGDTPSMIAVRLDSVDTPTDSATTWRGVPLATVSLRRPSDRPAVNKTTNRDKEAEPNDSVRARILAGPMLAATAAETWLKARALDAARVLDSQPGGPTRVTTRDATLPAWFEAGALRLIWNATAADRAAIELRDDSKHVVPLASLFAVKWTRRPNAMDMVRSGGGRADLDDGELRQEAAARERNRRDGAPGVSPLFLAQSVSVLSFIRARDPALVPRLATELARGASVSDVLASSSTLPHDVTALDAAWRQWLRRSQRNGR